MFSSLFSRKKDHSDLLQLYTDTNSDVRELCNTYIEYLTIEKVHACIFSDSLKLLGSGNAKLGI